MAAGRLVFHEVALLPVGADHVNNFIQRARLAVDIALGGAGIRAVARPFLDGAFQYPFVFLPHHLCVVAVLPRFVLFGVAGLALLRADEFTVGCHRHLTAEEQRADQANQRCRELADAVHDALADVKKTVWIIQGFARHAIIRLRASFRRPAYLQATCLHGRSLREAYIDTAQTTFVFNGPPLI